MVRTATGPVTRPLIRARVPLSPIALLERPERTGAGGLIAHSPITTRPILWLPGPAPGERAG